MIATHPAPTAPNAAEPRHPSGNPSRHIRGAAHHG